MTKKTEARDSSPRSPQATPRRRPLARGNVRRALSDPAIFDAVVAMAEALETAAALPIRANRCAAEVVLRQYIGALRNRAPRPWTAKAEARLNVYQRALRTMPAPLALVTAWAEVPERSGR